MPNLLVGGTRWICSILAERKRSLHQDSLLFQDVRLFSLSHILVRGKFQGRSLICFEGYVVVSLSYRFISKSNDIGFNDALKRGPTITEIAVKTTTEAIETIIIPALKLESNK